MRFERDVNAIRSYLAEQTTFGGDAREKLTKMQQIITLLDLDAVCPYISSTVTLMK